MHFGWPRPSAERRAGRTSAIEREAPGVHDVHSLMALMRFNDYENDPVSNHNPYKAIAGRFDLNRRRPLPVSPARFAGFCLCSFSVLTKRAGKSPRRASRAGICLYSPQGIPL